MIQFTLSLSMNQIIILQAIKDDTDTPLEGTRRITHLTHALIGMRPLVSERLVENNPMKVKGADGRERTVGWQITEKGRLALRLVELDVKDFANIAARVQAVTEGQSNYIENSIGKLTAMQTVNESTGVVK